MGIRTVIAAALPSIFADMGEDAFFTPAGGAGKDCKIFIDFNVQLQPDGLTAQTWQQATVIEALLSDPSLPAALDPYGIGAEPNRGDTFVYDEITYTVGKVIENDGFTVKVAVT